MTLIHPALSAAQAEIKSAQKSGDNKFDHYQYAKLEDFMAQAKPIMAKHGLALVCSTEEVIPMEDRTTKNGGVEHCVRVRVSATLYHTSGECITAFGFGEGQDRADKAIYKAITGAKKYLVAGLLAIPTTDDPEADEAVGLSDAKGKTAKVATATGEIVKSKPKWSPEQLASAGTLRRGIEEYGGDAGAAWVTATWKAMAYDKPEDTIAAFQKYHDEVLGKAEGGAQ
jgi:hypothetical protein